MNSVNVDNAKMQLKAQIRQVALDKVVEINGENYVKLSDVLAIINKTQ